MNTPRIEDLAAFMRERHNIYLRRRSGVPGPWTEDPVLREGRFCNVFRELDTVTRWIRKNIREHYAEHEHLWFMLAIARYINWPETLAELIAGGDTWPSDPRFSPERLTWALEERAKTGAKVYTGAYMIRAESDKNRPWYYWTKHRYIAEIVLGNLWKDRDHWSGILGMAPGSLRLETVWNEFQQPYYTGWGPFMAYEVVTDLRHTRYLRHAPDIMTWANAGPGAIRGLNRLFGRDLKTHPKAKETNEEMRLYMETLNADSGLWPSDLPSLELRDVEHSLCEFDKYERVRLGEGKMRSKYNWKKAEPGTPAVPNVHNR